MKTGVCYVFGAGDFQPEPVFPTKDDMVIAADGGYLHLEKTNIQPDVVLGDFDSSSYQEGLGFIKHPAEKNDTDTSLAVKLGLRHDYNTFVIYGGTGGRVDHTFANLQTLCMLSKSQAIGYLVGKRHVSTIITNGTFTIPRIMDRRDGRSPWLPTQKGYISVFSFSHTAKGVTLEGLKYPLAQATLHNDDPLGVSNEFTGNPVNIRVDDGSLLIIWEKTGY